MTEEKFTSGRGGKREGAGRPFAEKPKKMFSFRLSEEEEKAVKMLLKEMRNNDLFKIETQIELMNGFKPFVLNIQEKYNDSIRFSINYDTILIYMSNKNLKDEITSIVNELIEWAKNELDEEYYLPLDITSPGEMWSLPSREDLSYSWLLYRKLKEVDELE